MSLLSWTIATVEKQVNMTGFCPAKKTPPPQTGDRFSRAKDKNARLFQNQSIL